MYIFWCMYPFFSTSLSWVPLSINNVWVVFSHPDWNLNHFYQILWLFHSNIGDIQPSMLFSVWWPYTTSGFHFTMLPNWFLHFPVQINCPKCGTKITITASQTKHLVLVYQVFWALPTNSHCSICSSPETSVWS